MNVESTIVSSLPPAEYKPISVHTTSSAMTWDQLFHSPLTTKQLQRMSTRQDWGHLLVVGTEGAGKLRRVRTFLTAFFGGKPLKLSLKEIHFQTGLNPSGSQSIPKVKKHASTTKKGQKMLGLLRSSSEEKKKPQKYQEEETGEETTKSQISKKKCPPSIQVIESPRHVEVNLSYWKGVTQERLLIRLIDTLRTTRNVQASLTSPQTSAMKVLVILRADELESQAQHCMLQLIEKYVNALRLIFICHSRNRLISPLQSRCITVPVRSPSVHQVADILEQEARCWKDPHTSGELPIVLPRELFEFVAERCEGNLHLAFSKLRRSIDQHLLKRYESWKEKVKEAKVGPQEAPKSNKRKKRGGQKSLLTDMEEDFSVSYALSSKPEKSTHQVPEPPDPTVPEDILIPGLLRDTTHIAQAYTHKGANPGFIIRIDSMFKDLMGQGYSPPDLFRRLHSLLQVEGVPYDKISKLLLELVHPKMTLDEVMNVHFQILKIVQSS